MGLYSIATHIFEPRCGLFYVIVVVECFTVQYTTYTIGLFRSKTTTLWSVNSHPCSTKINLQSEAILEYCSQNKVNSWSTYSYSLVHMVFTTPSPDKNVDIWWFCKTLDYTVSAHDSDHDGTQIPISLLEAMSQSCPPPQPPHPYCPLLYIRMCPIPPTVTLNMGIGHKSRNWKSSNMLALVTWLGLYKTELVQTLKPTG